MGIQAKDIKMKGSQIAAFFGGILLIGLCFGQPIQESLKVEDLTNMIASSGLDRNNIDWDGLNNFKNQDPEKIVKMLDKDGDGKISKEEIEKDLKDFEEAIGLAPDDSWELLNKWFAQNAPKFLDVAGNININNNA